MIDIPVLISGAGPVGMTLALNLSRLGVRSVLLNDRRETTSHPKLDVVNCRSMEIFRQLGLAERIRAAGNPVDANQYSALAASASGPFYSVMSDRHLIYQPVSQAEQAIRACRDGSLPLESMQRIAQMYLEPVLMAEVEADPNIELRMGWRLYGFEQSSTGVVALAHEVDSGESQQFFAQYLVGCDGPNSRVRNFLNIDYDGTRDLVGELFIIHLRSDEIAGLFPNAQPYWHTWLTRPGFGGLLVSPDASRNDYVLHRPFAPRPGESLESVIDSALGVKLNYQIVQSGPWRPQFLVARSFGRQRVFIAGDATHQFMPTGGLGMNTGVAEAHNLAWKLAACLAGWGGPRLLESYEAERLPVARRNRDHVKKCAAATFEAQMQVDHALLADGPVGDAARLAAGREFERKVSRLYESLGVEIGYRYHGSPVIEVDTASEPPYEEIHYNPTTWSGARLPSGFREDGTALFDQLSRTGFTLLAFGADASSCVPLQEAARECGVPLEVLPIHEKDLGALYERRFVLVRPDQHVCWRGDSLPVDCYSLFNRLRGAR
ncbi:FAD-dependent monooxygenase [Pseudomonas sp. ZM23]|uniref:FAD-dependent monooxygenase n=1 Tax=Pseudomonas triclosanedens TaxID=2961893 RepID=A0ABY6ZRW4_9PSED|nr:FAD-dependent monooxygenase [Pseudomonas triclosanedens]MCP8467628.1 FAD-dependent monooxygenase [Pseudomonas triclosanedens]MCP8473374.1 FAD-dependent monooxygenase [Pseudomonas triclosanedens]MCP8479403.1 FAD-dependent monooxygenase [Pseudomonas triclosanedens]WAI47096.1 FAD-dependent monooxygenase [Pseudomonas triclosanedens]